MTHDEAISRAIRDTEARLKAPFYCGHPRANLGYVDRDHTKLECKVCKEIAGLKGQLMAAQRDVLTLRQRSDEQAGEIMRLQGEASDGRKSAAQGVPVEKVFAWADRINSGSVLCDHRLLANEMRQAARYAEPAGKSK